MCYLQIMWLLNWLDSVLLFCFYFFPIQFYPPRDSCVISSCCSVPLSFHLCVLLDRGGCIYVFRRCSGSTKSSRRSLTLSPPTRECWRSSTPSASGTSTRPWRYILSFYHIIVFSYYRIVVSERRRTYVCVCDVKVWNISPVVGGVGRFPTVPGRHGHKRCFVF